MLCNINQMTSVTSTHCCREANSAMCATQPGQARRIDNTRSCCETALQATIAQSLYAPGNRKTTYVLRSQQNTTCMTRLRRNHHGSTRRYIRERAKHTLSAADRLWKTAEIELAIAAKQRASFFVSTKLPRQHAQMAGEHL